jgi:hypothetical protein
MPPRTSPAARRRVTLTTALLALSGTVTLAAASGAQASSAPSWPGAALRPGNLLVATSVYENDTNIAAGTTQLPPGCGSTAAPCATAVVDGAYPYVFNNASVDPSFGVTSPITLRELTPSGRRVTSLTVPNSTEPGVRADANQMVTSFSSKSELALNLSTDGRYVTFMGYAAPIDTADVSNANTPGAIDPTNPVPGAYYRAVASSARRPLPVHRDQRLQRRQRPRRDRTTSRARTSTTPRATPATAPTRSPRRRHSARARS